MIKKVFLFLTFIFFLGLSIGNAQTVQTYNSAGSNTWTCPVGVTSVTVECFGAGGCGSARTNSGQNAGGGGGAYASSVIAVTAGTNYNVTVGAGGTSAGTNNGGNSSFNAVSVVAAGGTGLANGVATGAAGGLASASTGTIKFNGGTGGNSGGGNSGAGGGGAGSGGAGSNAVGNVAGASVADNIDGTGGTGVSGNSAGNSGNSYGGGGAGGSRSSNGNRNGGNGADGAVILTYCSPMSITTQPASVAGLCSGSNTSFNVVISGVPTTYQWQRDPNTGTFADITSAGFDAGVTYSNYNTATLNLTGATSALNNYKYRCVITAATPCSQTLTTDGLATLTFVVAAPLNGTYTIGGASSPSYASLTAAFAAMSCGGITGNVNLVLQSGYVSTVETFPLVVYPNATSYSITIYPAVTGLSITSANTNETINFDGADNYIIDGRVNQAGAMDLIVENTTTTGVAIQFINDASYNIIKYCNVKGSNTNVVEGNILFSTAASTGNDYNMIDHCDVHESATGTPYDCINSTGTTGSENDHNTVSNCNIYNFYIANNLPSGIDIEGGNTDWTITGNSFYQTSTRVPTGTAGLYPIYIISTGNNYIITNNYIGGTAASCGGTPLTFDAGATQQTYMNCIYIQAGSSTACTVQNNTVKNITMGCSQSSNNINFYGVTVGAGYVNISNNTIGSTTGNGSISITYAAGGSRAFQAEGIYTNAVQGNVSNNIIGSITISGGNTGRGGNIFGIETNGTLSADFIVSNNVIGSTTTANSIQYSGGSTNPVVLEGIILLTSGAFNVSVTGNTIQNLTNSTTGGGVMYGINNNSSSLVSVTTNTIANIATAAPATGALIGVFHQNTTAGQTISYNVIHDLSNTTAGATTDDVYGIYYSGPTTGANSITGNTIYNLLLSSTSTAANIYGLYINSGLATTSNNMIDLGVGVGTGYGIFGIYQNSATTNNHHYFNSVYIGGTAAAGAINTNAFYSVTATHNIENNIFYNNRTGGTGKHYAIDLVTKAGVTSNYNDLLSSVAANLGSVNGGAAALTLANWKAAAPAGDANSINSDPLFAGQTSSPANLHLSSGSPCGLVALAGTGITTDIDLEPRSTTPDIGADEYHTNYYSKSAGNLELTTSWGTATDGSGANPPNFTTRDCVFNIRNNATPTIGAAWTVSGSGDVVVLGDGTTACNFTIPGAAVAFTGTINISNNGTLTNQNTTNPTFNNINAGSTVNYNSASGVAQTVATATYGNLILSNMTGSGSSTKSLAATVSIVGDLSVNGYTVFDMVTFNANRTGGGGTLTVSANGTLKLSGNSGGASTTNNFPNNFSTMSLASASTVEYYSATAQNIYPSATYGNLTTTTGVKTAGGNLTIAGNLTINAGSTFAGSTYTHLLQGDFLNSGTFTANTSTMDFNNTSGVIQHIGPAAGSITTFATLKINNKANVTMLQDANVNTALTLTSGLLNTSASGSGLLIMLNGSTAPALTSASSTYVNGPMQYQKTGASTSTLNFPIGTSPDCRPVVLTVNHTNGTQYNYTAQLHNSNPWVDMLSTVTDMPSTVDTISGVHYWTIDRTSTTGTVVAAAPSAGLGYSAGVYPLIQLNFGTNDGVYQGSNLTIVKNTSAATATWIDIGATCALGNSSSPQAGSVTSTTSGTPFNSFSSFTLGSKNTGWNPLPIELLSFTAVADGNKVDVKWETVTETHNAYFTIEKSKDGKTFTKLIDVPGAGNSTTYRDYAETDYQPYEGTSYYRLKQTDANGAYKYFAMVPVTFIKGGQQHIVIYPNPINSSTNLNIELNGYKNQEVVVVLRDIQGKEFLSKVLLSEEDGHVFIVDETKSLAPGTYIITASSNDKIYNYKLIVR